MVDKLIETANRLSEEGDHLQEIEIYGKLISEGLTAFYLNLALLDQDEDPDRARVAFERLSTRGYRPAIFALGNLLHESGRDDEAVTVLHPLVESHDEFGAAAAGVAGVILAARGSLDAARPLLQKGAATYPEAAEVLSLKFASRPND